MPEKSAELLASEIIMYHGEIALSPGQLLTLARGIVERDEQLELAGDRLMGEDL